MLTLFCRVESEDGSDVEVLEVRENPKEKVKNEEGEVEVEDEDEDENEDEDEEDEEKEEEEVKKVARSKCVSNRQFSSSQYSDSP